MWAVFCFPWRVVLCVCSVFSVQFSHSTLYLSFHSFRIVDNSSINLPKYGYLNATKKAIGAPKNSFCSQTEKRRKVNELLLYKCVCDSIRIRNIFMVIGKKKAVHQTNMFLCSCFKAHSIVSIKTI